MVKEETCAHTLSNNVTVWSLLTEAGYAFSYAGENIAVGFTTSKSVVDARTESLTHRKVMFDSHYTDIGVGIASGYFQGYEGYFIVQLFATPL